MPDLPEVAIRAEGVGVRFGDVVALDGLDLTVPRGEVLGLLGPNGAGKTTLVRALATLQPLSAGTASVLGHDVAGDPRAVRRSIGLAGQFAAVDAELTGRENVEMVGRLYQLPSREARRRADEVLERLSLTDAADRRVGTYSGGMRRRLDLGASLVGRPPVLLLDEPTTGLDPRTRQELWDTVDGLRRDGTTVLLTTQYLEEADRLAQRIAVVDDGRIVAEGTASELKAQVGAQMLVVRVAPEDVGSARGVVVALGTGDDPSVDATHGELRVPVADPSASAAAVRGLDEARVGVLAVELHQPSLDDVFLSLTGHKAEAATDEPVEVLA